MVRGCATPTWAPAPGPGSAADGVRGAGVHECRRRGRLGRRQSGGQQRADHPGQHVAGAGGGRPGLPGRIQVHRAAGVGDDGDVALEQHGGAERRRPSLRQAPDAVVAGRRARPAGRIRRRAASAPSARSRSATRSGWAASMVSPSASTITGRSVSSANHSAAAPASSVPSPGPTTQACTRPAAAGVGDAMTSGHCDDHLAVRAAGVAHHAGGGGDRGTGAQHGGARIRRRAGHHPGDALGVLVVVRAGHRPARGHVGGLEAQHVGVGGRSSPMSTSSTRPQSASACTGLSPPKVTVSAACTAGPVIAPVVHVDAAGDVDGDHRDRRPSSTAANTSAAAGRSGPEPEMPTTPSMTRSVVGETRFARCGRRRLRNAASALRWVCSGLSRTASAAAPRRRRKVAAHSASPPLSPEPTTAHTRRPATPPVRAFNSRGDRGGQPEGGAAHQCAVGQAGQQRRFGVADRVCGVVVPHQRQHPTFKTATLNQSGWTPRTG